MTTPSISSLGVSLRYHWKHALGFKKLMAVSFVVGPISIILDQYIAPLFIAAFLSQLQHGTVSVSDGIWLVVGYATVQIIGDVIGYRVNLRAMWAVQIYGARDIYKEAYDAIQKQSVQFHNDHFGGSLVSQVSKTAAAFISFWNVVIYNIMFVVVATIATLIGVGIISWPLALILALFVAGFTVVSYIGTRFMRPRQVARSKAYSAISAQVSDAITNMVAVKVESNEMIEDKRLAKTVNKMVAAEMTVRSGIMRISTVNTSFIAFSRIAALLIAVLAVQNHAISAGSVYILITYTLTLLLQVSNINSTFRTLYQISGDSEEMLDIMSQPPTVTNKKGAKELVVSAGAIDLANISYAHEKERPLFRALSLHIPAGQKVGLIGISGSGKTTLTKLLLRLIDVDEGAIRIDDQNIADATLASLHRAIAYVPQEPLLFHRSLKENISYSRPDATMQEIEQAAQDAQAYDFIKGLPDGFDTLVGERGVKLSGGQRQRVAIARALLKNAPILIFDEATSALDSESEVMIQQALDRLMANRTSIVVAHRLSTIAKLDRIIVMNDGQIIEDGTHAELLKQKGTYARLWARQSDGFIEEDKEND